MFLNAFGSFGTILEAFGHFLDDFRHLCTLLEAFGALLNNFRRFGPFAPFCTIFNKKNCEKGFLMRKKFFDDKIGFFFVKKFVLV